MSNTAYVTAELEEKFIVLNEHLNQPELLSFMVSAVTQVQIPGVKIVSVVGGAASGKTTIAEELVNQLCREGVRSAILSTDNYVVGDREFRMEKLKHADAQKKYDFVLMDKHVSDIRSLKQGDPAVEVPILDPETGVSVDSDAGPIQHIGVVDALVIEGDFPRDDYDMRFYVHMPDEQRLQNSIDREMSKEESDLTEGDVTDAFTARQRTHHKTYTLPALQSADYVMVADVTEEEWFFTLFQRKQA